MKKNGRGRTMSGRGVFAIAAAVAGSALLGGCGYRPGSAGWAGASQVFTSSEHAPKTVTIVDTRTGEEIWTMDIPPGRWLVCKFQEGGGHDQVNRPDVFNYQVFNTGTKYGRLRSSITVPPAGGRRIDVTIRPEVEYGEAPRPGWMPTFEKERMPEWWTPEAGPWEDHRSATWYMDGP